MSTTIPFATLLLFLVGCSTQPLKPLAIEERLSVRINPLRDLTGTYNTVSPSFEDLAVHSLLSDFFVGEADKFDENKFWVYQNFLRPHEKTESKPAKLTLAGDVERVSYEPVRDIQDAIVSYAFFGLIGLSLSTNEEDMGVYLQYRFYVLDDGQRNVDTLVVVGVAAGDPSNYSRSVLTAKANEVAACHLTTQLCLSLLSRIPYPPKRELRRLGSQKESEIFCPTITR